MDDDLPPAAPMDLGGGTTAERVAELERELGIRFPAEYVAFLIETNGAAGPVGDDGWASLYSVDDLLEANRSYLEEPFDQFKGLVLFGNDGGGEAFGFDREGTVIMAAYIY